MSTQSLFVAGKWDLTPAIKPKAKYRFMPYLRNTFFLPLENEMAEISVSLSKNETPFR